MQVRGCYQNSAVLGLLVWVSAQFLRLQDAGLDLFMLLLPAVLFLFFAPDKLDEFLAGVFGQFVGCSAGVEACVCVVWFCSGSSSKVWLVVVIEFPSCIHKPRNQLGRRVVFVLGVLGQLCWVFVFLRCYAYFRRCLYFHRFVRELLCYSYELKENKFGLFGRKKDKKKKTHTHEKKETDNVLFAFERRVT